MVRRFAKVSEEEIVAINEVAFHHPSDVVNTKTTIPLRVGEAWWIYTSTLRASVYIHHYSPTLRGIVVYYSLHHRSSNAQTLLSTQQQVRNFMQNRSLITCSRQICHEGSKKQRNSRPFTLRILANFVVPYLTWRKDIRGNNWPQTS